MATKELMTRIALKYDLYEAWTTAPGKDLVLLKGELGICEIPSANVDSNVAPTVLFKVGDGKKTFEALPWASAKAADVYGWAKSETVALTEVTVNAETGEKKQYLQFKTGATVNHSIDLSSFATDAEVESVRSALNAKIVAIENSIGSNGDIGKSVADHESRLDIIEGADTVDGSIAKALKDAKKYTDDREVEIKKYADQAETDAVATAKGYTDTEVKKVADALDTDEAALAAHIADKNNPHGVTAAQVGLGNVDNKSVATIKSEFTGAVAASDAGFVTGGAVHTAIEAAKTAANTYADGLNTAMDTRVDALEAFKTAQNTTNSDLAQDIADEATARENADKAINDKIGTATDGKDVATVYGAIAKAQADAEANAATTAQNKVDALANGQVKTNKEAIAAMDGAYKAADTAIKGRLDTVEGKLANVSNVMDFRGAVSAKPADGTADYQNGDVVVVTGDGDDAGKEFVYDGAKWHEFGYADGNAAAISGLQGRMTTAEGEIDALQTAVTDTLPAADTALGQRIDGVITAYQAADATTLASAKGYADEKDSALKTELQGYADNKASAAQTAATNAAKSYTDDQVEILEAADTAMAGDITALKQVTNGYSGDKAIKTAVDAKLATATFDTWTAGHEDGHAKSATEITTEITNAVNAEKSARETAVSGVDAKVTALTTRVTTAETDIDNAEKAIEELEGRVKSNEDVIADLDKNYVSETEFTTFKTSNTSAIADAKKAGTDADAKAVAVANRVNAYDTYFGVENGVFPTTLIFNCGSATEVIEK